MWTNSPMYSLKISRANLVSWSCGKYELTIRIERQAVHFSSVSIYWVAWFGSIVWTSIPTLVAEEKKANMRKAWKCWLNIKIRLKYKNKITTKTMASTHIISFWSSATDPNRDSCSRCQETSSTTAVCPVKMVFASTTFPSFGTALISHRQMVLNVKLTIM